jgi:hypothetical protein
LTPRVKILPDEVNAKATRDTDKDGVMLVRGDRVAAFGTAILPSGGSARVYSLTRAGFDLNLHLAFS